MMLKWILLAGVLHVILVVAFLSKPHRVEIAAEWSRPVGVSELPKVPAPAGHLQPTPIKGDSAPAAPSPGQMEGTSEKVVRLGGMSDVLKEGNQEPAYPLEAVRKGWQGKSKLRVEYRDGKLQEVVLEESSGYPVLDKAAVSAARLWKFNWLLPKGKTSVYVPVVFELVE